MNTSTTPGTAASSDALATVPPLAARDAVSRLAQSREHLADWLAQDRSARAARAASGWGAALAGLPLLEGLVSHPVASLALGALAKGWLQRPPPVTGQPVAALALSTAFIVVRRHPKLSLGVAMLAGVALLWSRARHPSAPPT
jgi:hypothetical protein